MSKRGAKLKLTDKSKNMLIKAIKAGNYHHTAASIAGLHVSSFYRYLDMGEKRANGIMYDDKGVEIPEIMEQLYNELQIAEADAESKRIERIEKAGKRGDWKADAWYLERRYPERWGRRDRITADLNHGGTITNKVIDLSYMSDEELEKEIAKYE